MSSARFMGSKARDAMGRPRRSLLLSSALFSCTALSPAVSWAAQADQAGQAVPAAAQGGLGDIVVTARKRAESTQDIPVSVTALGADQIARYDLSNLERVAASTPQFAIGRSPSGSGATLVLRGIGSNSTSIGLEQSVAVVVDGVYYGQGRIINEGFFDLERMELLKGPQALFYGKNATAGVISIASKDPTDTPEYLARIGYEFRGQQLMGEAVASGPISDTVGVRLAVRASDMFGSYFKNLASPMTYRTTDIATGQVTDHIAPAGKQEPGNREFLGRFTLRWTPTDALTATLKASASNNRADNPASSSVLYRCRTGNYQLNPAVPCGENFHIYQNDSPAAVAEVQPHAGKNGALGNRYRAWAVTATIEYDLDEISFTSVSNYNRNRNVFRFDGDSGSAPLPAVAATEWSTFDAFSSEFRVLTDYDGPINAMAGVYYQKTKRDYLSWTAQFGVENSAAPHPYQRYLANSKDSESKGETIAGFGQLMWQVVPEVELTAGVRYTHETKDSYFVQPYAHPTYVALGIFSPNQRIAADQTFSNWSPEITASYQPTEDITLYAAYKTAYKSGGFSNSGILSPSASVEDFAFNPETAKGFEGGIKTTLFDRQLRFNVGAYWYKYSDLQLDFFRSDIFAFSTINAGSATSKGIEAEFDYAPMDLPGLTLRGSINYNKARYGDVPLAPCYQGQTPAAGCSIIPGLGGRQNLKGKPTAMAPLWTASLGAQYETQITDALTLGLSADARYSDDYLVSAFGHPFTRQNSYVNLDASVRLRTTDDQWELALIGKNLTNRFYATGGVDAPATGGGTGTPGGFYADQVGYIAMPRTVQLQATWRY